MPGFKARWRKASWPKEDLDCSAAALVEHGMTLRLNLVCINAKHHQAGGDGDGPERLRNDRQAAQFLKDKWNNNGYTVFKRGRNDGEVIMFGGLASVEDKHPDVAEAISAFNTAAYVTKYSRADALAVVKRAVGKRKVKRVMTDRQQRRAHRGSAPLGRKRKVGRRNSNSKKLTQVQRNALNLARKAIKKSCRRLR